MIRFHESLVAAKTFEKFLQPQESDFFSIANQINGQKMKLANMWQENGRKKVMNASRER